uniref:Uncharacterized protein n=1 Tax=Romanomermis culicivorax TaxID=13658 RepID=A0A915KQU0_ROMCU
MASPISNAALLLISLPHTTEELRRKSFMASAPAGPKALSHKSSSVNETRAVINASHINF